MPLPDQPVVAAWGAGTDSTALIIEMVESGQRLDYVLHADTGDERSHTRAFIPVFMDWLRQRGVPCEIVRYQPTRFKNHPPYQSLGENLLTNATLPSITFGRGSTCALKWKVAPQDKWMRGWPPAIAAWSRGAKVTKLIGYSASPRDLKRYADQKDLEDPRYEIRTPLVEWGWTREMCVERIAAAGLPQPKKSSCAFCVAVAPQELHAYTRRELRMIVLIEARARPRLRTVEGLWRTTTKGARGKPARPGRMTDYIRAEGLLPAAEIDDIEANAPLDLIRFRDVAGDIPEALRPTMAQWLAVFASDEEVRGPGERPLYGGREGWTTLISHPAVGVRARSTPIQL